MKCPKCARPLPPAPCFTVNVSKVRPLELSADVFTANGRLVANFRGPNARSIADDCEALAELEAVNLHFHWLPGVRHD